MKERGKIHTPSSGNFSWKVSGQSADTSFISDTVESEMEVENMGHDPEHFCGIYRELAELLGESATTKIWKRYKGLNCTFPKSLYSKEYIRTYIDEHKETMKPAEIARAVGLTERRVRQILRELRMTDDS